MEDMNGNGKANLVWRNSNNGIVSVWLMDRTGVTSSTFLVGTDNSAWFVVGNPLAAQDVKTWQEFVLGASCPVMGNGDE